MPAVLSLTFSVLSGKFRPLVHQKLHNVQFGGLDRSIHGSGAVHRYGVDRGTVVIQQLHNVQHTSMSCVMHWRPVKVIFCIDIGAERTEQCVV